MFANRTPSVELYPHGVQHHELPPCATPPDDAAADAPDFIEGRELARMTAEAEAAIRPGDEVFRLECEESGEVTYVAAGHANGAYRKARRAGWPQSRRGPINVESVWGDYSIEARRGDGIWTHHCTVRARSALHALLVARRRHPALPLRPSTLWSAEAYVRVAA